MQRAESKVPGPMSNVRSQSLTSHVKSKATCDLTWDIGLGPWDSWEWYMSDGDDVR